MIESFSKRGMHMRKVLIALIAGIFVVGCSTNQIEIKNESDLVTIHFLFRGEEYTIGPSGSLPIEDIPNGAFAYSTTVSYTSGTDITLGEGLAGTLDFLRNETEWVLLYGSRLSGESIVVECNLSTNANFSMTAAQ